MFVLYCNMSVDTDVWKFFAALIFGVHSCSFDIDVHTEFFLVHVSAFGVYFYCISIKKCLII